MTGLRRMDVNAATDHGHLLAMRAHTPVERCGVASGCGFSRALLTTVNV